MMFELITSCDDERILFEAPGRAVAALVVIFIGFPCCGARGLTTRGRHDRHEDIPNPAGSGFADFWTSLEDGPYETAYRRHRDAVIFGLASARRTRGRPLPGYIDLVERAHKAAASLRAASSPAASRKEAAE